jgi:nucleoside-diphosphate kinase
MFKNQNTSVTLIIIKPDANSEQREEIKKRLRENGLALLDSYTRNEPDKQLFEEHYAEHKDKHFFKDLIDFMTSGCCFYSIWSGENAVEKGREVLTQIRSEMRNPNAPARENLIHASDSKKSAKNEIRIWFPKEFERYEFLFR